MSGGPARVALTPQAADLLRRLRAGHGPLMFHQSGGCCDGSAPMCYPDGDFIIGGSDVHLADLHVEGIEPVPFYMSESQFALWRHTHLTVDVVEGRGSGFSLEAPEGLRFLIRSRLLSEAELQVLDAGREPAISVDTSVKSPNAVASQGNGHGQQ
jgi:uncharacterized protein (DUF779 family)